MQRTLSILIHGLSKTGKSTFISSAPKPLLYLDVEGGTRFLNLRKVYWEPGVTPAPVCDGTWDVCVVMVRDYDQVKVAYDTLASGTHCFEAVVIDSVSRLQTVLLEKIAGREQARMQDWGDVFRTFMGLIRDYHGLTTHPRRPMSVGMVSESKETEGVFRPFVQGQSKSTLPYVFDVVAAAEIMAWFDDATQQQRYSYVAVTGPHNKYETGERVNGRIPPVLADPTFTTMLDYVYGVEPSTTPPPTPVATAAQPVAYEPAAETAAASQVSTAPVEYQ